MSDPEVNLLDFMINVLENITKKLANILKSGLEEPYEVIERELACLLREASAQWRMVVEAKEKKGEEEIEEAKAMENVLNNITTKLANILQSGFEEPYEVIETKLIYLLHEASAKLRMVVRAKYNIGEEQIEEAKAMGKAIDRMLGM